MNGSRRFRRGIVVATTVLLPAAGLVALAGPAQAVVVPTTVTCGQTITVNTVLAADVGPCSSDGIILGADNITLDLNSHTVTGVAPAGEGVGVHLSDRTGDTVKNGTVTLFDAGVAIEGGSGNTVTGVRAVNNLGFANGNGDYGDGILVFSSTHNVISGNQVNNNGPFDGIGLLISSNNVVDSNQITNNNQSISNTAGIRLENIGTTASNSNTVTNNMVTNSGTFGIELFAGASDNTVRSNQVIGNRLDGITVFAGGSRNRIDSNNLRSNGANGIYVRGAAGSFPAPANNVIVHNQSFANTQFDLRDGTPNCGTNTWSANVAATGTPPCVLNP